MKKIILLFCVFIYFFSFFNFARAESVIINLKIYSGDTVLFDGPETVNACAESPEADAPIALNGKCALEQSGLSPLPAWIWYDFDGDGKKTDGFLDELGGISSDNVNYIYWGWFSNLTYGATSLNSHILSSGEEFLLTYNSFPLRISASKNSGIVGDTITFTAEEKSTFNGDFSDMLWTPSLGTTITLGNQSCVTIIDGTCSIVLDTAGSLNAIGNKTLYVPSANLGIEISEAPIVNHSKSGGSIVRYTPPTFDVAKALAYLKSVQDIDGSFGDSSLYTDWAGIALESLDKNTYDITDSRNLLLDYFKSHSAISSLLTDNERHTMALLTLRQNPYSFNGVNYIKAITDSFDGAQFGDLHLDNDDIFALIPLASAGYTASDDIIRKDISFVISAQNTNGSWDESVDMTAVAIQALKSFESITGVAESLTKATDYLTNYEGADGGWGNVSSTSWAMQTMSALNASWTKDGKTGLDYLTTQQTNANNNGSVLSSSLTLANNIWETSYAIPAVLGKPWSAIMQTVSKPAPLSVPLSPTIIPIVKNTPIVPPATKKSVVIAPLHISAPATTSKVSPPISSTEQLPTNVLSATAEGSKTRIPIIVTVILIVSLGGVFLFRRFKLR